MLALNVHPSTRDPVDQAQHFTGLALARGQSWPRYTRLDAERISELQESGH